jgi:hypothetical protein
MVSDNLSRVFCCRIAITLAMNPANAICRLTDNWIHIRNGNTEGTARYGVLV